MKKTRLNGSMIVLKIQNIYTIKKGILSMSLCFYLNWFNVTLKEIEKHIKS